MLKFDVLALVYIVKKFALLSQIGLLNFRNVSGFWNKAAVELNSI